MFEDNNLFFYGVQSQIYRKTLTGNAQSFGIKLFTHFIGIHPKWLIQRLRLHQVLAELQRAASSLPDLASLALSAGYYDQAHFNADFVTVTGFTPLAYWRYLQHLQTD